MQCSQPGLNTFPGIILFVKENAILLYIILLENTILINSIVATKDTLRKSIKFRGGMEPSVQFVFLYIPSHHSFPILK